MSPIEFSVEEDCYWNHIFYDEFFDENEHTVNGKHFYEILEEDLNLSELIQSDNKMKSEEKVKNEVNLSNLD